MSSENIKKTKVLVIEDEPTQRRILEEHLSSMECYVLSADNGLQGLSVWEKNPGIRIVITDLDMPDLGGFNVVTEIRKKESKYTYIMILTSIDDKTSLLKGLSLGADDFVSKPVTRQELALRLKSAVRLLRLEDHDKLIGALSELAATRSGEIDAHLKRIKNYCSILAKDLRKNHPDLGITRQNVEDITHISVLHDIGKICIPEHILNKRGKYTSDEREMIKEHTVIGAKILEDLYYETASDFLHTGYELIVAHHEKWDGSGYPNGLKGENIPIAARIMAFADAYDAILSKRPYKDPLPQSHAESIAIAEKGKQFDPRVVDAYLRNKEAFSAVHEKYPEPSDF